MKIVLGQMSPRFDTEENLDRMVDIVNSYKADIYVFPELYLTGYLLRDRVVEKAIRLNDGVLKKIKDISKDKVIIFGFPEKAEFLYNSAGIAYDGELRIARKIYLPNFGPFEEKLYFKEGNEPFVIATRYGKIGVQICYDAFFPEIAKIQALKGAELIVNISASPITSRAMFEKIIPARAIENTVFMVYVNWAGLQRTMEFWGGSMVYSPRGNLLYKAPYFDEDVGVISIDMTELEIARRARPTLRDTNTNYFNLQYP